MILKRRSCPSSFCQKLSLHSLSRSTKTDLRLAASSLQPPLSNMLSNRHQVVEAFHVPRSTIGLHTPGRSTGWPWRPIIHQLQRRRKKRERTIAMFSVLGAEARRLMLPGPVVAAAHCKTHQKLEIFGNFVASRSAGPFVGRHFLLERHFAGEMISVGKARRCPFKGYSCLNLGPERGRL